MLGIQGRGESKVVPPPPKGEERHEYFLENKQLEKGRPNNNSLWYQETTLRIHNLSKMFSWHWIFNCDVMVNSLTLFLNSEQALTQTFAETKQL